jgi:transcriptional regulator with XRE-family HTH domain
MSGHEQSGDEIERSFGQVLRKLREDRGLSQEELGFESGYHRTYISQLERGQKSPSLQTVFQLAKALRLRTSEFIAAVESVLSRRSKS